MGEDFKVQAGRKRMPLRAGLLCVRAAEKSDGERSMVKGTSMTNTNQPLPWAISRRLLAAAELALLVVRRVVDAAAILLLCAMTFLILFQILGRYVFNYSISWSEEAAIFAQIWLVMLGAGIAMRNRHHVGVDFLIARCPPVVRQVARSASFLLGAAFLVVVIVGSFSLIGIGFMLKSAALQIPMAVPYIALPVGMTYFLVEFAIAVLPEIQNPDRISAIEEGISE